AVGDNVGRLVEVLQRAFSRSDLVICTGGLGPTEDDVTREAIAATMGEDIVLDPDLESTLRGHFARRGGSMPERNLKQATLIKSARALPNPRGTAPGWWVERGGHVLVAMPGVPHEMRHMWETQVVPRLKTVQGEVIIHSRLLKVIGLGESAAEERIRHLLKSSNPTIGTYAKEDGIHLRLTAKAESIEQASAMVHSLEAQVRAALGIHVYGADEDSLAGVVGQLLMEKGLTLASMESCTGGLVANVITNEPGSSAYFKGGLVTYSNAAKVAFGVPQATIDNFGAVSPETALDMAEAARRQLGSSVGLAVTGVAGPSELEGKPPGTVHVAVDVDGRRKALSPFFPVVREQMKRLTMLTALDLVRRTLLGTE